MGYKFTNCRRVKKPSNGGSHILEEGWVGVDDEDLHFRPTRGAGGYSVYSTEKQALSHTGCARAIHVALRLEYLP